MILSTRNQSLFDINDLKEMKSKKFNPKMESEWSMRKHTNKVIIESKGTLRGINNGIPLGTTGAPGTAASLKTPGKPGV